MADISNVSTPIVRPSVSGGARSASSHRAAYADAGDVSRRANVLNTAESPENQSSLNRLDRALSSDQPLRGDVPRGFYLNIKV
ncbi:MAG: hypothetical protein JKY27_11275 [Magnetovibrio sp.]|nr:hypothetical protein [Magnetovibrio sp.]